MTEQPNKEFTDLLNQLINENVFNFKITNGHQLTCKQLSTAQLKELIKASDNDSLIETAFSNATTKIINDSVINLPENYELTILDRLFFLLETRGNSLGYLLKMTDSDGEIEVDVDIKKIIEALHKSIETNKEAFQNKTHVSGKFALNSGVPTLKTEASLNKEIYSNLNLKDATPEQLTEFVADSFIYELTKYVSCVTLEENKTLSFENLPFISRVEILQKLPAGLLQQLIEYVATQKSLIEECMVVESVFLGVDSSLFVL